MLSHWEGEPVGVWATLWNVDTIEVFDRIGSTNDRARRLAEAGCAPFTVVIGEEQTAGRGRGGASWYSPPGSGLWMSLVLPATRASTHHLPLLVGLAVSRAIEATTPRVSPPGSGIRPGIEWPNDVVVEGRKVAGILCESAGSRVVAGIGINVRVPEGGFPPELGSRPAALEQALAGPVSRSALAGRIVAEHRAVLSLAGVGEGAVPPELLAELSDRDALTGRPVVTQQAGDGVARGFGSDGTLILERPDGSRVAIFSGSVTPT